MHTAMSDQTVLAGSIGMTHLASNMVSICIGEVSVIEYVLASPNWFSDNSCMSIPTDSIRAIRWEDDHLTLLDQRALPLTESYLDYRDAPAVADAIRSMVVRGAPAIGITAA